MQAARPVDPNRATGQHYKIEVAIQAPGCIFQLSSSFADDMQWLRDFQVLHTYTWSCNICQETAVRCQIT